MKSKLHFVVFWLSSLGLILVCLQACQNSLKQAEKSTYTTEIAIDQEIRADENKVINSSTQSINRYSSNLRDLQTVKFEYHQSEKKINFSLKNHEGDKFIQINNIDIKFICPQLPYQEVDGDKFDIANLILAEYSRNSIGIPIQKSNDMFAQVSFSKELFNDKGEYIFEDGNYKPNAGVLPKRLSVINNCLRPGLWEFSASDAVGEMYHSWFEVDKDFYYKMIENLTGIRKESIPDNFNDPEHFNNVNLELDRLRNLEEFIGKYTVKYNSQKVLGGYSSQDSRRKVQRKFYEIERNGTIIKVKKQEELKDGDMFSMFSFQEPGIYDPKNRMKLKFNREWDTAEVFRTNPKTQYSEKQEFIVSDYIELKIYNKNKTKAIVIGNLPLALLSFRNDFIIPAFGVGVFSASEPIERRLLRSTVGPHPSFAYLTALGNDGNFKMVNNHLLGYEQVFLRPVIKGEDTYIRVTLVSYERITDLIEFEIKVNNLKDELIKNNKTYHPPIYETYQDDNTL